ncbi:hypothetical protein T492DRAFT_873694 [Pavlovales sp. CCMP2436]|nr:hypothetical protein T492DRAFT_873694 [Pavlovales sp. CCMP2436]
MGRCCASGCWNCFNSQTCKYITAATCCCVIAASSAFFATGTDLSVIDVTSGIRPVTGAIGNIVGAVGGPLN